MVVVIFDDDYYWSSTEISLEIAFSKLFFNGNPFYYKGYPYYVRAVRAF